MKLHPCAAEQCTKRIPRRHVMCGPHWDLVPRGLQRDLTAAARGLWRRGKLSELREYQRVRAMAIAAVREKEVKRQLKRDAIGDVLPLE